MINYVGVGRVFRRRGREVECIPEVKRLSEDPDIGRIILKWILN
jgi:hypothetical protein